MHFPLKYPFAILIVALFVSPARAVEPLIVEHGARGSKMVALTFDACPTSKENEYDEQVIEVLMKEKVPATLFMSGRWVEKNEAMARSLAGQPQFEIANHAFRHPHMLEKDDERILAELKRTQAAIRKATGRKPKYFRPPFGEVDERLAKLAAQAGLITIQYDIASGDPDAGLSAKRIARAVVADAKGGSIVVFHMNTNGPHTAEALPEVIKGLRERGFTLVTVGEMLKRSDKGTGKERDKVTRGEGDKGTGPVKYKAIPGQGDKETRPSATAPMEFSALVTTVSPTTALSDALYSSGESTSTDVQNAVK
ncbi:MAG: polysaccharide deacetylase family protein [Nitrospirota bacterium]